MNKIIYDAADGLLPARQVCERYKIVGRTLARWLADERLEFPRPLVINKRRYFKERLLENWERSRATVKR